MEYSYMPIATKVLTIVPPVIPTYRYFILKVRPTNGGAFDDNVRHSMTKLSHLHFPSNDNAVDILRLGEGLGECGIGLLPF